MFKNYDFEKAYRCYIIAWWIVILILVVIAAISCSTSQVVKKKYSTCDKWGTIYSVSNGKIIDSARVCKEWGF